MVLEVLFKVAMNTFRAAHWFFVAMDSLIPARFKAAVEILTGVSKGWRTGSWGGVIKISKALGLMAFLGNSVLVPVWHDSRLVLTAR
jgi:hypothetical protein